MKKALSIVLIYYILGCALSYLIYKIVPHTYIHAPGLHHFVVFLMFLVSFIWGITTFFLSIRNGLKKKYYKWISVFNLIPVLLFVIWFFFEVNS